MKKFFMFLAVMGVMAFSANIAAAQDESAAAEAATEEVAAAPQSLADLTAAAPEVPLHQALKTKFIEGGAGFMSLVIICLIIGLALAIERILYLSFSKTNATKLVNKVEELVAAGKKDEAIALCKNSRGPVAVVLLQAVEHSDKDLAFVERTIVSYGSVEMSRLESGLSWISLFIAIAPSLGFLGTVIGMIQAFDAIQAAGDISPNVVAGGMKVALITTVAGLIVAMILQLFYNYILAKIESISIDMETSSAAFVEFLADQKK